MEKFKKLIKKLESFGDLLSLNSSYKYVAYLRRSVKEGTFKRQENNIREFSEIKRLYIEKWYKETCSGLKPARERTIFKQMFDYCYEDNRVIILVDSTDRFSRCKKTAIELLKLLKLTDAKLYFIRENLLVNPINSKNVDVLLEYVQGAHSEVELISYRLKNGYKQFIKDGGKVGRKEGYKKNKIEYSTQYVDEIKLLGDEYSLRRIRDITGTSVNTLRKLKKMFYSNNETVQKEIVL